MQLKTAVFAKCLAADVALKDFHISMNTDHMFNKVCLFLHCFLADLAAKLAHLLSN